MQTSAVAASTFPLAVLVIAKLLATVVGMTPMTINPTTINGSMLPPPAAWIMVMMMKTTVGKRSNEIPCVTTCRYIFPRLERRAGVDRVRPVIKKMTARPA